MLRGTHHAGDLPAIKHSFDACPIFLISERVVNVRNNRSISQRRLSNSLIRVVLQGCHIWLLRSWSVIGNCVVEEQTSPFLNDVDRCDTISNRLNLDVVFWMGLQEFVGCRGAEP
jgi:hypothetical protein